MRARLCRNKCIGVETWRRAILILGVHWARGICPNPREYISVSAYRNHNIMLKLGGPSFPFLF